jgi:hypothetical protein
LSASAPLQTRRRPSPHRTQAAAPSWGGTGSVKANEHVVEAFLQDVVNEHNGGAAANFLTP